MIAFGCIVSEPEPYRRYAEPGISLVREWDSRVYPFASVGTIGRSYNLLLRSAAQCDDLEALVIVHPHTQIDDRAFGAKVRAGLTDPEVAVLGAAGATGARSIAWWEAAVSCGQLMHRYTELGGGEIPAYGWAAHAPAPRRVDAVDEFLLVLSPWAVRNISFDEALTFGYGSELDYCLQVRCAGRALATLDTRVIQHRSPGARRRSRAVGGVPHRAGAQVGGTDARGPRAGVRLAPAGATSGGRARGGPGDGLLPAAGVRRARRGAPDPGRRGHRHPLVADHRALAPGQPVAPQPLGAPAVHLSAQAQSSSARRICARETID